MTSGEEAIAERGSGPAQHPTIRLGRRQVGMAVGRPSDAPDWREWERRSWPALRSRMNHQNDWWLWRWSATFTRSGPYRPSVIGRPGSRPSRSPRRSTGRDCGQRERQRVDHAHPPLVPAEHRRQAAPLTFSFETALPMTSNASTVAISHDTGDIPRHRRVEDVVAPLLVCGGGRGGSSRLRLSSDR